MSRVELKKWAKGKIKGHVLELLVASMLAGFLINLSIPLGTPTYDDGKFVSSAPIYLGFIFGFVEMGYAYYMLNFINDKPYQIKDIFNFSSEFSRGLVVKLLKDIFTTLWALLLIVPGVIKSYAYSLTAFILIDDKYKDLSYMDVLKKSEELMNGHKMDLFVFDLSFIAWHLLAIFTLGLLELWIVPYYTTAKYKLLEDIMNK